MKALSSLPKQRNPVPITCCHDGSLALTEAAPSQKPAGRVLSAGEEALGPRPTPPSMKMHLAPQVWRPVAQSLSTSQLASSSHRAPSDGLSQSGSLGGCLWATSWAGGSPSGVRQVLPAWEELPCGGMGASSRAGDHWRVGEDNAEWQMPLGGGGGGWLKERTGFSGDSRAGRGCGWSQG